MKALRDDVLAALREAEQVAAATAPGTPEREKAAQAVIRLRTLCDDIEAAMRLGITDRGDFAALFDEVRMDVGPAGVG